MTEAFEGLTVEEFETDALDFLSTARDARFDKPYRQLIYQPMVELLHYLRDNGFQVFLTSGGGRDFMRAVCEEIYDVPRAQAIGSSVTFTYAEDARGVAQVVRTKEIEQPIDDGPGKPLHIHRATGRRPILAGGNSDGDIHMLKYAAGHAGPSLGLLVHHDDAEREYAYDAGAQKALRLAAQEGWVVVSMKDDWTDRLDLGAARLVGRHVPAPSGHGVRRAARPTAPRWRAPGERAASRWARPPEASGRAAVWASYQRR